MDTGSVRRISKKSLLRSLYLNFPRSSGQKSSESTIASRPFDPELPNAREKSESGVGVSGRCPSVPAQGSRALLEVMWCGYNGTLVLD